MYEKAWNKIRNILLQNNEPITLELMDDTLNAIIEEERIECIKDFSDNGCNFKKGRKYSVVDQDSHFLEVKDHVTGNTCYFHYGERNALGGEHINDYFIMRWR